jgi:cytochrome c-type biogenesis protein CcmH/NrfG
LRKNYALLLIAGAVVVAAAIVFVGSANHSSGSAAPAQPVANGTSLPPGHPKVNGNGSASNAPAPDYSKMIAALKAKLDKNPADAQTIDALGTAYFMNEQYDKAKSLFARALRLHPGDPGSTVRLAMVYHAKGDVAKAKSLIQAVLKKRPDFQEAHYDLAIIYFSQQRLEQAKAEWEKTASIDPKSKLGQQAQNFVDLMEGRTPAPSSNGQ